MTASVMLDFNYTRTQAITPEDSTVDVVTGCDAA